MTVERKKKFMVDVLFIAFVVVLVYFALKYLTIWMLPFFIGLIIALILQRPVAWLSKKTPLPRGFWSFLLVLTILCALFGLIGFLGSRIYSEVAGLVSWITERVPEFKEAFADLSVRFSGWLDRMPVSIGDAIRNSPSKIIDGSVSLLSSGVSSFAKGIIVNVPGILLTTILSIIASCFITNDYNRITHFILCQFSNKNRMVIRKAKNLFTENILKMFRGYLIIMAITFVELLIGLSVIGIEYSEIIAMVIALMDILPVLGCGTVLIPWGVIDLILGNGKLGIEILGMYALISVIRNIIEPKIIGKQVGLPPIVTLMAMYLGLQRFGIFGLFGLPIIIIIIAKLQESGMIHIWKTSFDEGKMKPAGEDYDGDELLFENVNFSADTPPEKESGKKSGGGFFSRLTGKIKK